MFISNQGQQKVSNFRVINKDADSAFDDDSIATN